MNSPFVVALGNQWILGRAACRRIFTDGPPLAPRIVEISPLILAWNAGPWQKILARKAFFRNGRLTLDEHIYSLAASTGRCPIGEWCATTEPSELLLTPVLSKDRYGPTESIILAPRAGQVIATVEHVLAPRHHVVLRLEAVGCDQPPAGRVEWHYRRKTSMTETYDIAWNDCGTAELSFPMISQKDMLLIRFDNRSQPANYLYLVRIPVQDPGGEYHIQRRPPDNDQRPKQWTYVFLGLLESFNKAMRVTGSLATLPYHEALAQSLSRPGPAILTAKVSAERLLKLPSCVLQCLLDHLADSGSFDRALRCLNSNGNDVLSAWLARPQDVGLLTGTPALTQLVQRCTMPTNRRLSSLAAILYAGSCTNDVDLAMHLNQCGDSEIDVWLTILAKALMSFHDLRNYCVGRGWKVSSLDLMELDGSLHHLKVQPLDELGDELIALHRSPLHDLADESIELTRTALAPLATTEQVRAARQARNKLRDLLKQHLEKLINQRPKPGPWDSLRDVIADLQRFQLTTAIRRLRRMREQYSGKIGKIDCNQAPGQGAASIGLEPCLLKIDATWVAQSSGAHS